MKNHDELLFTVDDSNNPLPPTPRGETHKKGYWHRTTQIWIINKNKQVLCQRRSLTKEINPGMWESFFGGHVTDGEDYLENAYKEIKEELGLTIAKDKFFLFKIHKQNTGKEFRAVYFLQWSGDIQNILKQEDEVEETKWVMIEELKKLLRENKDKNWNLSGNEEDILQQLIKTS